MNARSSAELIDFARPNGRDDYARHTQATVWTDASMSPAASSCGRERTSAARFQFVRRAMERIQQRAVPFTAVVALHVLLVMLALVNWRQGPTLTAPSPLQVRLIEQPAEIERSTPLPPVEFEQPRIEPMMPELPVIQTEPASTAITVSQPPTASPVRGSSAPAPAVTLPSFDADYLSNPAPVYPSVSRRLREEGLVVLRVRVAASGTAVAVQVERTSGSSRLDAAAVHAVERWRFVPARRGDDAVEAWVLVPIEFELKQSLS